MISIQKEVDTRDKLRILSHDSQYDLACACGMNNEGIKKAAPVLIGAALLKLMPETYLAAGAAAGAAAAVAGRFSQKIQ